MSRKGHYPGGHTTVGRHTPSYFSKDSLREPPDDGKAPQASYGGNHSRFIRTRQASPLYGGPMQRVLNLQETS